MEVGGLVEEPTILASHCWLFDVGWVELLLFQSEPVIIPMTSILEKAEGLDW